MKWAMDKLKVIHWHFEPILLTNKFMLVKPELKVTYEIYDILDTTNCSNLWFKWRFRLYEEGLMKAYLSLIGEQRFYIEYEKTNDEKEYIEKMFSSSKMNFLLNLQDLVLKNRLSPNIRYNGQLDLSEMDFELILKSLKRSG
jgi:hypothetical protein